MGLEGEDVFQAGSPFSGPFFLAAPGAALDGLLFSESCLLGPAARASPYLDSAMQEHKSRYLLFKVIEFLQQRSSTAGLDFAVS